MKEHLPYFFSSPAGRTPSSPQSRKGQSIIYLPSSKSISRGTAKFLLPSHLFQMLQNRKVGIHPPINTILCAGLFTSVHRSGGDLSGDAFLPAHICELVNSYW